MEKVRLERSQVLRMKEIERVGGSPCHVVTSKEEADCAILDFYEKHFSGSQKHKDMGSRLPPIREGDLDFVSRRASDATLPFRMKTTIGFSLTKS